VRLTHTHRHTQTHKRERERGRGNRTGPNKGRRDEERRGEEMRAAKGETKGGQGGRKRDEEVDTWIDIKERGRR